MMFVLEQFARKIVSEYQVVEGVFAILPILNLFIYKLFFKAGNLPSVRKRDDYDGIKYMRGVVSSLTS